MKNFMKKIIVGFAAFLLLLVGNSVFASGPFNGQSGDCNPTIGIGNYSTGNIPRDQYGCWTSSSTSASAGDTINVGMYYHNNTGGTLSNVRASVSKSSSGPTSTYTFTGTMYSDQGTTTLGTVTLNLSSSQTLTYSSTHLMKGRQAVLSDTDTSVVYNENGIDVGSVPSGWDDFGTVIYVYKVGNNNNYNDNCTISNFTVNGQNSTYITSGNAANFNWNTYGCSSVSVSGPNLYSSNTSGSSTTYPTNSGTYTLTAYGNNSGTQTRTVYVNVDQQTQNNCNITNFTANGTSSTVITSGNPVNLSWSTYGCNSVSVSGPGISSNVYSSTATVYPSNNAVYTINAYGNNSGTQTRTVYVTVNSSQPIYSNSCAVTLVATNVGQTSATLNGVLSNVSGSSYFQYGTTTNLGMQTSARNIGSGSFSEVITGLTPGTTYFYRPVAQCANGGMSYGLLDSFTTLGTGTTIKTIIRQGTTVIGTASPIMLKIENRYQAIGMGDVIDYTVTYKNIGKSLLTKPVLQVIIPRGITLTNASRGTYALDTNTLTVELEDLTPGAEGVVYLQGRVDEIPTNVAQVVTTAILVYTSPSGAQENAIAYVLNNPKVLFANTAVDNNLGAAAFFAGLGRIGLIGWLIIIILILLAILLTRRYYSRQVVHTTGPNGSHTTTTHY